MLERFGEKCESAVRRYMPDPFVLVLLLTLVVVFSANWFTPSNPQQLLDYWYGGFWELLSFAMQMVLIVVTGEAIAEAPVFRTVLKKLCSIPRSAQSALFFLTLISMVLGWLHWGFGLVAASLIGREMARGLYSKKITVHYPLMGTAAYMSMLLWHAGTTASAPLLINTPGHFLFSEIGLIPLRETIFLPRSLFVCAFLVLTFPLLMVRLIPRRGIRTIDDFDVSPLPPSKNFNEKPKVFSEKLEKSYVTNLVIGAMGLAFLLRYFSANGLNLNHNIVNLTLLTVGLLLHRNPMDYSRAVANSVRGTSGIILQFPFYGGIMGILGQSGLGVQLAQWFVGFSNAETLPFFAYLASVLTKFFIPSGGGEWAIEGPVMLTAAKNLGAPVGLTTMGVAYGNMVGNMFQPFWAIPLLSIMGLRAKDIMGYCLVVFCFAFPILGIALLLR